MEATAEDLKAKFAEWDSWYEEDYAEQEQEEPEVPGEAYEELPAQLERVLAGPLWVSAAMAALRAQPVGTPPDTSP